MCKKIFSYLLLCCICVFCPLLTAYAEESNWDVITGGANPVVSPLFFPSSASFNGTTVNLEGLNCFCYQNSGSSYYGYALFSDSPTLIATPNNTSGYISYTLSAPSGYSFYPMRFVNSGSYPNFTSTTWYVTGTNTNIGVYISNPVPWNIIHNDFVIVDSEGNEIDIPPSSDKFHFRLSAYTDYSLKGESWFDGAESNFRVKYYIVPAGTGTPDLAVGDCFELLNSISVAQENGDTTEVNRLKEAFRQLYPIAFASMDTDMETVSKIVETVVDSSITVPSPSATAVDAFLHVADTLNIDSYVTTNSYHNWRGFGGGYIYNGEVDSFDLNVLSFYSSVRNLPNYTDLNRVYCCFYSTSSDASYCFLYRSFRVSDFMPTVVLPNLNVPSPDVIDDLPSFPSGSSTDWTIYQHAMYMQYLLGQLDTNFKISITDFGNSFKLPDYDYTYNVDDLVPYDYDLSVPDVSAPDGVPLELARPVSFLGSLWSGVLESTGLTVIIPWCMIIGLVAWFFYGKG